MEFRLHFDRNGNRYIYINKGEPPWYEFKNPMTVLYKIFNSNSPPYIQENLSPELKDFLKCCLRMEPTERFNVFQLLRHPFITGDIIVNSQNKIELSNNMSNNYNSGGNIGLNNLSSAGIEMQNKNANSEFGFKYLFNNL